MKKHLLFILILGFFFQFTSCQQENTKWKGTIEDKDGVIIVKNPKEPIYGEDIFSLTEDLSIGRAEGQEEYMFLGISSIDVDEKENIYVADSVSAHIRVFDRHGQYIRTIGRKGQGPGEMQMPYYVQITSKNELLVQDFGARRLLYYALNGNFLRQSVSGRTGFPLLIKMDSFGNFIGIVTLAPPPLGGKIFQKYDPDINVIKTIAEEKQGKKGIFDIGKTSCYCDISPSDNIIWGDSKEYVLQILNPQGVQIKRILKDPNPLRFTEKDKEMYEHRYAEPIQAGYELKLPSHFPAFKDIFVDEKERIFVQTYQHLEGEENLFYHEVFDPEGKYIARVPVPANLNRNSVWKTNRLYTIDEDAAGLPVVKRYQISWFF